LLFFARKTSLSRGAFLLFLLLLLPALVSACHPQKEEPKKRAALVTVAKVIEADIPLQIRCIGNVEAFSSVAVRSSMGGELKKVFFKQGQEVKKGQLLFSIDPRLPMAALRQAEANLAKDKAQEKNASVQYRRYEALFKDGGVSREQYEQLTTNLEALRSTVDSDRAALENARTQLSYASIFSPIDGRTGSLLVNEGNLVRANDTTALVEIHQLKPIFVSFSLPQQGFAQLQRYRAAGQIKVSASPQDGGSPDLGTLSFLDNEIDQTTGTIRLKATFPNAEQRLWPGQFVQVSLDLATQRDAVLVPSTAVQVGQKGKYVFVLKKDSTVVNRNIESSRSWKGCEVVEKGLSDGESVVTDGLMQLEPGAEVRVQGRKK
jgi:multidrug efflux system membrane fusion protein